MNGTNISYRTYVSKWHHVNILRTHTYPNDNEKIKNFSFIKSRQNAHRIFFVLYAMKLLAPSVSGRKNCNYVLPNKSETHRGRLI